MSMIISNSCDSSKDMLYYTRDQIQQYMGIYPTRTLGNKDFFMIFTGGINGQYRWIAYGDFPVHTFDANKTVLIFKGNVVNATGGIGSSNLMPIFDVCGTAVTDPVNSSKQYFELPPIQTSGGYIIWEE